MGYTEDVYRLASQVLERKQHCKGNEEATKHSLILPFFQMLGFDIYNPSVLRPEYKAGFASNKEKIDYAIFQNDVPALFIEAKAYGEKLENYDAQLAKYFNSTTNLKLAVITDGVRYKFFTDLKEPNIIDIDPFLEFDFESIGTEEIEILKRFQADKFNAQELVNHAENLVYLRALKKKVRAIFREPSDDFVRFMAGDVFPKKITANALERLTPLVKQALSSVLVEMVSMGLSQEISKPEDTSIPTEVTEVVAPTSDAESKESKVVTTEEELAGFNLIYQLITEGSGEDQKVTYKDTASYFGIHVEKRTQWFARLHFNGNQKFVVLRIPSVQGKVLLGETWKVEEYGGADSCRVFISSIEDIRAIKSVVLAAYRMVTATTVY